ncbi:MAG: sensor histidine kinase [Leptolyngbyaceae cyanobacterium]
MAPKAIAAFLDADHSNIDPFVPRLLRYAEWALFGILEVSMIHQVLRGDSLRSSSSHFGMGMLILIAILSCFFPIRRPLWQRRAYVLAEMACITLILIVTAWELGVFYFIFLVRSCFLLPRRDVMVTMAAVIMVIIGTSLWSHVAHAESYLRYAEYMNRAIVETPHLVVTRGVINSLTNYIPFSAIVVLACLTLVSERESRQQATALAEKVSTLASDLERSRIAREIHDALGHTLTALDKQITLAQQLHTVAPEDTLQAINQAEGLSVQSLQEARATLSTLRQGKFDLVMALDTLVEQVSQSTQLTVHVRVNVPALPFAVSHQVYLIVKEILGSFESPDQMSAIVLWIKVSSESIMIVVEEQETNQFESFVTQVRSRLQSVEERIRFLQGQLEVNRVIGKGMSIQVSIPK